ncbi:MAG: FG-GAP-like repeat-containing protein, partial [Clostridium sp.]|nr:FG-GAP-like repeat-containing protein [Clostridium sp.]
MKRLLLVPMLMAASRLLSAGQETVNVTQYVDSTVIVTEEGDILTRYCPHPLGQDAMVQPAAANTADPYLTDPMSLVSSAAMPAFQPAAGMARVIARRDRPFNTVGKIPFSESVSPSGARIYDIPIATASDVPFVPSVSLQYSSQSGEGMAGYGWTLSGLSSIVRTGKSMYYHSEVSAPLVSDADAAFSLDGVPVLRSSKGVSGYTYETVRGNILVRKFPATNVAAKYFEVLYPNGSKAVYGFKDGSGGEVSYPLTEVTDIAGNRITVSYGKYGGQYDPETVSYNYDAAGTARSRIQFSYAPRSGYTTYYAGAGMSPARLLKSIISEDAGNILSEYTLEYSNEDYTYLLTSVSCTSGNSSLNPLEFTYGSEDSAFENDFRSPYGTRYLDKSFSGVKVHYIRGKFHSGHYSDGLIILPALSNYCKVETYQKKVLGITTAEYYKFGSGYSPGQSILIVPSVGFFSRSFTIKADEGFQTIEAIDVDDDGTDEIVKVNFNGLDGDYTNLRVAVYKFNETVTKLDSTIINTKVTGVISDGKNKYLLKSPHQRAYWFGKFSDKGGAQLVTVSYNTDFKGGAHQSHTAVIDLKTKACKEYVLFDLAKNKEYNYIPYDLDNDGKGDMCCATTSGLEHYSYSNGVFTKDRIITGGVNSYLLQNKIFFTDMNGDGLLDIVEAPKKSEYVKEYPGYDPSSGEDMRDYEMDVLKPGGNDWDIYSYNGESFVKRTCVAITYDPDDEFMFLDINHDGLADLLKINGTQLTYYINNLGDIRNDNEVVSRLKYPKGSGLIPANVTSYNSASEFIIVDGFEVHAYEFSRNRSRDRLLTSMTDGFGVTRYNTYHDMSGSSGVYQIESQRSYSLPNGFSRRAFPMNLLYSEEAYYTAGNGSMEKAVSRYYTYYDAVCSSKGLGFCGFGKVRMRDYVSGTVTVQEYDPEKFSAPTRQTVALSSSEGTPFAEAVNTYDSYSTTYGKLNPRLTKSVSADHLTGVSTETSTTYGTYSFPVTTVIERKTADGAQKKERHDYKYTHNVAADRYVLGAVSSETIQRSKTALLEDNWIETTEFTYDDAFRPLTKTINVGINSFHPRHGLSEIEKDTSIVLHRLALKPDTLITQRPLDPIDTLIYLPDLPLEPERPSGFKPVSETRWTYNSAGKVVSEMTSKYGSTEFTGTVFEYDQDGRHLYSETDAIGRKTTYESYDKFGNPGKVTDCRGNSTVYTYDDFGNLTDVSYPDGTEVSTVYAWGGQELYTKTVKSNVAPETIIHYDALGREVRSGVKRFDGQWQFTDKVYNSWGLIEKVSLPFRGSGASLWTDYFYDGYKRIGGMNYPTGGSERWDYSGNSVIHFKDGIFTTKEMDANGDLVKVTDDGGTIEYELDDIGQPLSVTAPGGVKTTFAYDFYGHRTKMVDPSAGTYTDSYVFNPDGSSVVTQTNPNGKIVTYTDRYGRVTMVERPGEYNTVYTYDDYGLLTKEESTNGTSVEYVYDSQGRVTSVKETVPDGKWLQKSYTYGIGSQLLAVSYTSQSGYITTESYSYANGYNTAITLQDGTVVMRLEQENDLGQPTKVTTGGITREYGFSSCGVPTYRKMADGELQHFTYIFDYRTNNLMLREDKVHDKMESFGYDQLNRLTAMADDRKVSYSSKGNIMSIDGVGSMNYMSPDHPYRISSLLPSEDVVQDRLQKVSYTCYSRPSRIEEGGRIAAFTYNGSGDRVKMYMADGVSSVLTRWYVGGGYEYDSSSSGAKERLYLGGDAYSATMVMERASGSEWLLYNIGRDYLGNITHIATSDGTLVAEYSYDPWGRLRDPETHEIYLPGTEPELLFGRGFTGHEHLSWFGLINMNARLYDPLVGRFLSPAPYVQMPDFTQNFNRYSYALNNPLRYTDESGEFAITGT